MLKKLLLIAACIPLVAFAQPVVEERLEINRRIAAECQAHRKAPTFKFSPFMMELCTILPESFTRSVPLGQTNQEETLRVIDRKNQALKRIINNGE